MASVAAKLTKRGEIMKSLRERTIAVSVSPTPTSFAERRSILQVLEQYGQVDFFKAIPGRNPTFISVMRDEDSLKNLTSLSPLRYVVSVPITKRIGLRDLVVPNKFSKTKPSTLVKAAVTDMSNPSQTALQTGQEEDSVEKEFILNATPNPRYNHSMIGSEMDLQRSWPESYDQDNSFTVQTLKQSLPDTLAAKGLAHWNVNLGKKTKAPMDAAMDNRIDLLRWLPSKMKKNQPRKRPIAKRNRGASPRPTQITAKEKQVGGSLRWSSDDRQ